LSLTFDRFEPTTTVVKRSGFGGKACATVALSLLAALPLAARAQVGEADEAMLRDAVTHACWPGDIVRAADRYLVAFPSGDAVAEVRSDRQRAAQTSRLVSRNDLRLYRSAFVPPTGDDDAARLLRRAALGDRDAAVQLAQASRANDTRYVGWLQYASLLGDERASYELALHFRRTDQPLLAAQYETIAVALGYKPAPSLDNVRK